MKKMTIIMYHFVRELQYTKYPEIKALLTADFKEQLLYMQKHYQFVTIQDCIDAVYSGNSEALPSNAIVLTFDDAYIDHFSTVFPLLEEKGIQGCFFPPAKAILDHKVLNVNKIHFILAAAPDVQHLIRDVYDCLDNYRSEYSLKSNDYYFSKLGIASRLDPKEIIFIKRLLQVELEEKLRDIIVDELFKRYVTDDEKAFSSELYMSVDQLKSMTQSGMCIGSHGYNHYWLNTLSSEKQEQEIDLSIEFLQKVGTSTANWVMCYPYGAYNGSLIEILKKKNCKLAFTTKVGLCSLHKDNAFTLERLDTNDLPKIASAEVNSWTKQIAID